MARGAICGVVAGHRVTFTRAPLAAPTTQPEVLSDDLELAAVDDQAERQALFAQMLDRLPPDQRRVLEGRFFEQRSIRELAQELGRSEGAVKQLQFRALETLRNHMRDRHE